jgi:plasmid stabilization system protein ParE
MKVRYSPRATSDIIIIADYLAERNPVAARTIETAVRKSVALIGEFPRSGRALTQRANVRVMPLTRFPYLIFYAVGSDEVVILHVRHATRAPLQPGDL